MLTRLWGPRGRWFLAFLGLGEDPIWVRFGHPLPHHVMQLRMHFHSSRSCQSRAKGTNSPWSRSATYCGDGSHGTELVFRGYPLGQSFFFRLKRISEALLDNSFGLYLLIPLTLSSGFCTRDIITIYRRQYEKRRHFRNALHSIKTWPLLRSLMVNLGIWNNGILEIKLWLSMTFDPCCPGLRIQLTAPAWSFYTRPLQGKVARINVSWKEQKRILGWVLSGKFFFLEIFCSFRKTILIPMGEEVYKARHAY